MSVKRYVPAKGFPLDGNFRLHAANCEQCKRFNAEKPGTLALMCLEGSVLWKQENVVRVDRKQEWRPKTMAPKEAVKAAMKYKE